MYSHIQHERIKNYDKNSLTPLVGLEFSFFPSFLDRVRTVCLCTTWEEEAERGAGGEEHNSRLCRVGASLFSRILYLMKDVFVNYSVSGFYGETDDFPPLDSPNIPLNFGFLAAKTSSFEISPPQPRQVNWTRFLTPLVIRSQLRFASMLLVLKIIS